MARHLNIRLVRTLKKTAHNDLARNAALAIAQHVLPDLAKDQIEVLVRAIVEPLPKDMPHVFDPLLVGVLDEIQRHDGAPLKNDMLKLYNAAKGQEAAMAGEPQVLDKRAGRLIQAADRMTSREYLARMPGQGQIHGCRIAQPLGAQWIQGYYPKGPGDAKDSRFASWADGQQKQSRV